jgi:hypothetical protein
MDAKKNATDTKVNPSCFLTSATVGALGLPDDCEPLTLARFLRDEKMTSDDERAAVDLYYKVAPAIVARSTKEEWVEFWQDNMREITALVRAGEYELAKDMYTLATARLVNEKATRFEDEDLVGEVYAFGLKDFAKDLLPYPVRFGMLKLALSAWVPLETLRLKREKRKVSSVIDL